MNDWRSLRGFCAAFAVTLALAQGPAGSVELPPAVFATQAEAPPDAVLAATAVVQALRRGDLEGIENVRFAAGVGGGLSTEDFAYEGFAWEETALFRYDALEGDAPGRSIQGKLDFVDALGRRAPVLFSARYVAAAAGGIEIVAAEAVPLFSEAPSSKIFLLEAETFSSRPLPTSHADLMEFASAGALSWQTSEEIREGEQEYVIVVAMLDRISPSAEADVRLAKSEIGTKGFGEASRYFNDNGWRAGIVSGRFAFDETKLFVKVVFQPGKEEGFLDRSEALVEAYPLDALAEEAERLGLRFATLQDAPGPFDGRWKGKGKLASGASYCPASIRWEVTVLNNKAVGEGRAKGKTYGVEYVIDGEGNYVGEVTGWVGEIKVSGTVENAVVRLSRQGRSCSWKVSAKRIEE